MDHLAVLRRAAEGAADEQERLRQAMDELSRLPELGAPVHAAPEADEQPPA